MLLCLNNYFFTNAIYSFCVLLSILDFFFSHLCFLVVPVGSCMQTPVRLPTLLCFLILSICKTSAQWGKCLCRLYLIQIFTVTSSFVSLYYQLSQHFFSSSLLTCISPFGVQNFKSPWKQCSIFLFPLYTAIPFSKPRSFIVLTRILYTF